MSEKKFQVFISSTYEDLKEERKAVEQTIIRAGDFPVGMEAFPAADEEQFEFIKSIISQCDYYILIVAGRYGSTAPDGKSYTEKEYEYAVEVGIPVLVMLREDLMSLSVAKSETDSNKRDRLEKFIEKVSDGRLRTSWTTIDSLKLAVREALDYAKATKKRPGWIRGDQSASTETLEKLVSLQEENEKIRKELSLSKPNLAIPKNIAGLDKHILVTGKYQHPSKSAFGSETARFEISTSFGEVFELIAPHLLSPKNDYSVGQTIAMCIFQRYHPAFTSANSFSISDEIYQTIKIQLFALNLVSIYDGETTKGAIQLFWSLTELGKQEMILRRALVENENTSD